MTTVEEIVVWINKKIDELSKNRLGNEKALRVLAELGEAILEGMIDRGLTPEARAAYKAAQEELKTTATTVKTLVSGVPVTQVSSYIAFANELKSKTSTAERQIAYDKWKARGLTSVQLTKISEQYGFSPS